MYYSHRYDSPVGPLLMASNGRQLVGLWMEGQKYFGRTVTEPLTPDARRQEFKLAAAWLDAYFAGANPPLAELPLAPIGSAFQQIVWRQLLRIPYGETTTYGAISRQVAREMNRPSMAGQAIGGAVGRNPISIIIPCHRVVGGNGSLTGYAGGLARKLRLLTLEGAKLGSFSTPQTGTAL